MPDLTPIQNLGDWLVVELDKKLNSLPTDEARRVHCQRLLTIWSSHFDKFMSFGTQPFDEPHPVFGYMDAFDFRLLICVIEERRFRFAGEQVLA